MPKLTFLDKSIALHYESACFVAASKGQPLVVPARHHHFRTVSLSLPNHRVLLEARLAAAGFSQWPTLAGQLEAFIQVATTFLTDRSPSTSSSSLLSWSRLIIAASRRLSREPTHTDPLPFTIPSDSLSSNMEERVNRERLTSESTVLLEAIVEFLLPEVTDEELFAGALRVCFSQREVPKFSSSLQSSWLTAEKDPLGECVCSCKRRKTRKKYRERERDVGRERGSTFKEMRL